MNFLSFFLAGMKIHPIFAIQINERFFVFGVSFFCGQLTPVDSREHKRAGVTHGDKSGPVTGLVREARPDEFKMNSVHKVFKVCKVHKVGAWCRPHGMLQLYNLTDLITL